MPEEQPEYPWSDDDYIKAHMLVSDLADIFYDLSMSEEAINEMVAKRKESIGDPTIGFEKWANRFHNYATRAIATIERANTDEIRIL